MSLSVGDKKKLFFLTIGIATSNNAKQRTCLKDYKRNYVYIDDKQMKSK